MELTLPMNYVELEQEEMMYLDGGWSFQVLQRNVYGLLSKFQLWGVGYADKLVNSYKGLSGAAYMTYTQAAAYYGWPILKVSIKFSWKLAALATIGVLAFVGVLGNGRYFY